MYKTMTLRWILLSCFLASTPCLPNSVEKVERWTNENGADLERKISSAEWKPRPKLECIRRLAEEDEESITIDDTVDENEIVDKRVLLKADRKSIGEISVPHTGTELIYKIENEPMCSELSVSEVKHQIDLAAQAWNEVHEANVQLKNIEDVEDNTVEGPKSDISISFERCQHKKYRNDPFSENENFGSSENICAVTYGHAKKSEYIHLNTLMTWTDRSYTLNDIIPGDFQKPNLYTIALHEFGHVLKLSHSSSPLDVMFGSFTDDRKYKRLSLSKNDKSRLANIFSVFNRCQDSPRQSHHCKDESVGACNVAHLRGSCRKTCGLCTDCDEPIGDEYLKCNEEICNDLNNTMRPYCKKTCQLCEKCNLLPSFLSDLMSLTELPVLRGEVLRLQCPRGYKLKGSATITCLTGNQFTWDEQPRCKKIPADDLIVDVTTSQPQCTDKNKNCLQILARKNKSCRHRSVRKKCKMTCGLCYVII